MPGEPSPQSHLRGPTSGSADLRDTLRSLAGAGAASTGTGVTGTGVIVAEATRPSDDPTRGATRLGLDERTAALARLAALVALHAAPASFQRVVDVALEAGASVDDVVETLKAVARAVGLARTVSAAPGLALAAGYDVDRALETLDDANVGDDHWLCDAGLAGS